MQPVNAIFYCRESPIISVALHEGHDIPESLMKYMLLDDMERFKEEDPYTGFIADIATSQVVVSTSRFQVDLNRTPSGAVYQRPQDAWGLNVWKSLPDKTRSDILAGYDHFYERIHTLISDTIARFGCFLILDIHSYNHMREGPLQYAPFDENPELNIGTVHNHPQWAETIYHIILKLRNYSILGKELDVRENVKFGGGGFQQWVCDHFGDKGLVLSLEFKKTFMNEWTGKVNIPHLLALRKMLEINLPMFTRQLLKNKSIE